MLWTKSPEIIEKTLKMMFSSLTLIVNLLCAHTAIYLKSIVNNIVPQGNSLTRTHHAILIFYEQTREHA